MKMGKAATAPQGSNSLGDDKFFGTPDEIFELWVDNKRIARGTRRECQEEMRLFSSTFRVPYEKFTVCREVE